MVLLLSEVWAELIQGSRLEMLIVLWQYHFYSIFQRTWHLRYVKFAFAFLILAFILLTLKSIVPYRSTSQLFPPLLANGISSVSSSLQASECIVALALSPQINQCRGVIRRSLSISVKLSPSMQSGGMYLPDLGSPLIRVYFLNSTKHRRHCRLTV